MSTRLPVQLARQLARRITIQPTLRSITRPSAVSRQTPFLAAAATHGRFFSVASQRAAGIMPHTDDPQPPQAEPTHHVKDATPLEDDEYHEHADRYLDQVVARVEELQESREDVDVEYSAGVLNITFPPNGTYVINKQPPNKQIWLSSPITGPKRFDWVVLGESMDAKEGSGVGEWIYIRDGTTMTTLLSDELGITVHAEGEHDGISDPTGVAAKGETS